MGCEPYRNPAGLSFVTRVEFLGTDALYRAAQVDPQVILNIPNGAGPGTLYVGTHDAYASWLITDSKNLVRETQRAYTGAACWEQLWVEDGCTIQVLLLDRDSVDHYSPDGIALPNQIPAPRIFAQWFPAGTELTSFDRLSLCSGPPGTLNPYPFRTIAGGQTSPRFVPVGLTRFLSVSASNAVTATINNVTAPAQPIFETIAATTNFTRAIPAWGVIELTAGQAAADVAICWNRYPMIGS